MRQNPILAVHFKPYRTTRFQWVLEASHNDWAGARYNAGEIDFANIVCTDAVTHNGRLSYGAVKDHAFRPFTAATRRAEISRREQRRSAGLALRYFECHCIPPGAR
jgi:hypothetical protein